MEAKSDINVGISSLKFKAIDKLFIVYNILVLFLILLFGTERSDFGFLVGWHLILIGMVLVLTIYDTVYSNLFSDFLRFAYPALLFAFIHYESGILSPLLNEGYFDAWFIGLDRILFGRDWYTWMVPNMGSFLMNEIMNGAYFSFYLMILGVLLSTYIYRRQFAHELVFILTLCLYGHYFFFILFPVVGPTHWRVELFSGQGGLISAFMYSLIEGGDSAGGAFPSSHCAGAFVLNWYAGRIFGSRVALLLMPVTILLFISSVYLSMHYVIDAIAGILIGYLFVLYGPRLYQRLSSTAS